MKSVAEFDALLLDAAAKHPEATAFIVHPDDWFTPDRPGYWERELSKAVYRRSLRAIRGRLSRRLGVLLASLALAVGVLAFAPIVTATGTCSQGSVMFFSGPNKTGNFRAYCYGVNDVDMESESPTVLVMGPNADGGTYNDFDTGSTTSGISSAEFLDPNSTPHAVCIWTGKNFTGGLAAKFTTNLQWANFTGSVDNAVGSFRFITGSTCSG